jgi:sterol desaturase/sphingolipid hydroxylase (fatty acid hydroxylase superfamily)
MRVELNRRKFCNPWRLVPRRATVLYFGEVIVALTLAVVLLASSNFRFSATILLFACGVMAWSLAEYITHRFVLHSVATIQHGNHHARPQEPIDRVFWQIWLAFTVVYLITGGAVLAGVLAAYAWYLSVHHCAHHNPAVLPASLLKHHLDHHRFARRNYGVTTKIWDRIFGTMLR